MQAKHKQVSQQSMKLLAPQYIRVTWSLPVRNHRWPPVPSEWSWPLNWQKEADG